ncbi:urea ABC transporter membrane protein [Syntrophobotulus glycolicus DSM 8271]|uniref:Urea ABC transporter membrane protein n=1 Tax=Syntrophobotulus glycolicus (strain DSM 8271 / FlGlyR) TaxID=645991 RepID=F0STZ2_SYNGF|nr:urea ABC transporter permease subunit UrtC [Syntrophobotulus glycolicus]ADY56515.1 urea ABC transporter membrane protein [Syntrophobotulus glycolicus DSM 8271]
MIFNRLKSKENLVFFVIAIALLLAPLFLSDFRVNLLGKFIAYAILAIGIDLIWGYTGILSLGHGVYFGLGAYCVAMYLKLEAAGGKVPDFMSWSGLTAIPWFWEPFSNGFFSLMMAVAIPTVLAFVVGYLTFKNRIRGVYLSILSQALAIIFVVLFVGQQAYTGGTNGLTSFRHMFGFSLANNATQMVLYYIAVVLLILTYGLCKMLVGRRIGKILVAIRDGENRVRFSGYNPTAYKVFVYCLSAAIAGLAGAIFVPLVGIISPAEMGIVPSIEMVIWVAIGGKGTLIGAVIGAMVVNALKSGISESFPEIWSYFIGLVFIFVVLYMPLGIVGLVRKTAEKYRRKPEQGSGTGIDNPTEVA